MQGLAGAGAGCTGRRRIRFDECIIALRICIDDNGFMGRCDRLSGYCDCGGVPLEFDRCPCIRPLWPPGMQPVEAMRVEQ